MSYLETRASGGQIDRGSDIVFVLSCIPVEGGERHEKPTKISLSFRDPFLSQVLDAMCDAEGVEWSASSNRITVTTGNPLDCDTPASGSTISKPQATGVHLSQLVGVQMGLRFCEKDGGVYRMLGNEPLELTVRFRQRDREFLDANGRIKTVSGIRLRNEHLGVQVEEIANGSTNSLALPGGEWRFDFASTTNEGVFGGSGTATHLSMFPRTIPRGRYVLCLNFGCEVAQADGQQVEFDLRPDLQLVVDPSKDTRGLGETKSLWLKHMYYIACNRRLPMPASLEAGYKNLVAASWLLVNPMTDNKCIGYIAYKLGMYDLAYNHLNTYLSLYGLQPPVLFVDDQHDEFYDMLKLFRSMCEEYGYSDPFLGVDVKSLLPDVIPVEGLDLEAYNSLKSRGDSTGFAP